MDRYQAILFDLDGTLIDTAIDMIHALAQLADKHGMDHTLNVSEFRQYISQGAVALVKSVFNDPPQQQLETLRQEYLVIYQQQLNTHSHLFDGVAGLIDHLDQQDIPWGIVTNKPSWLAKPIVQHIRALKNSRILVCADEVGSSKPSPQPLLQAAANMDLNHAATLYLGDARSDVEAAHAAGMSSGIALWGYLAPEDDPKQWSAHHHFASPVDLLPHFMG
ncbi:HAD family hydrolase [Marinicella meishanensis]|uniref:HAD family hydrolase n=1 Tax=Marinicella meishanensis TaxID=2873263 RepID=UPI001CBFA535|nr:HAD-IA family hydrolase [Marinicella sp. NBU2979]